MLKLPLPLNLLTRNAVEGDAKPKTIIAKCPSAADLGGLGTFLAGNSRRMFTTTADIKFGARRSGGIPLTSNAASLGIKRRRQKSHDILALAARIETMERLAI